MATVSPTPAPGLSRRPSQRLALRRPPSRPQLSRSESNPAPAASHSVRDSLSAKSHSQQQYTNDSSDDEIPVPMKLSAITKALLNDDAAGVAVKRVPSPPRTRRRTSALAGTTSSSAAAIEERRQLRSGSAQAPDTRGSRPASPLKSRENSPVRKRVVRLSNTPKSLGQMQGRRSTSLSRPTQQQQSRPPSRPASRDKSSEPNQKPTSDVNTPAQQPRVVRIVTGSSGAKGRSTGSSAVSSRRSGSGLEGDGPEEPASIARNGSVSRFTSTATKPRLEESLASQSSMRPKRLGKVPGSFLSGPARRGKRRQSEEDAEENGEGEHAISSQEAESQPPEMGQEYGDHPPASSFYGSGVRDFASGSPVSAKDPVRALHRRHASNAELAGSSARPSPQDNEEEEIPYRIANPRPEVPSAHDQENEIPSTFKRPNPAGGVLAGKDLDKVPRRPLSTDIAATRPTSPERKPLTAISRNTPHRPAPPPPPKMSVLDAATSTAGAAASQKMQRRNILKVNGKSYTRHNCIGRGGSAKVYQVTAENGKMFALKRVALENADEATIKGFKGEIDLLRKLSSVDRVIRLFDYEMNNEKQALSLLMEMGEIDLNSLIRARQSSESARFDAVFVRFYWKEMLECLQSVHQHDIVHSDLKPANFVLVQGRLKLIDFGIANAIQTDETINVHRETQVGTPSYMSPESLTDSNATRVAGAPRLPGRPKLVKLGKPSDIWSLGCILYQMVYGLPPFGHIQNQMARCQAIINWDHIIEFPGRGMGGVPVPPSLIRTLRRCLVREQHMRPTCEELLSEMDPFLYPVEMREKALPMDEDLLGRIIQSVVQRCRERMPTEAESVSVWPAAYWASVKKTVDAGRMA